MKQSPALESKTSSQQSTGSKMTTINPCQQKHTIGVDDQGWQAAF